MDKISAMLRTLGVLLGLWVILAVVAIAANQVPELRRSGDEDPAPEGDAGVEVAEADAGPADSAALDVAEPSEPVNPDADSEPTVSAERWTVCPPASSGMDAPDPSLAASGTGSELELVVGCPDGWHVFRRNGAGLARVAVFTSPNAPAQQRARTGRAAIGDLNDDERPDYVLPLAYESGNRATRGGGLYHVMRDPYGGIQAPVRLAPIAAYSVELGHIDSTAGADIVAMNRANPLAQLPSESWVFGGGASPVRVAALTVGPSGRAVRIADFDRDGHADVISLSQGRVDLHFGDGAGGFERSHTLELEGVREIDVGDIDADGGVDLVVLGNGLSWIRAGALDSMEPRGIDGVPSNLRELRLLDVDGDSKLDVVGWDHPRLVVLTQRDGVLFEPHTGVSIGGGPFGPRRVVVAGTDVILLGTGQNGGALEVVLVSDALSEHTVVTGPDATAVPDAPLVLRAALP